MNILLWVIQILLALQCVSGALWRITHYDDAASTIASVQALPYRAWVLIGVFEVVCALGLVLPGLLKLPSKWVTAAALALVVEQLLLTLLHGWFFGIHPQATNPATWTFIGAVMAGIVVRGRKKPRQG
jgi:hypothetical protein